MFDYILICFSYQICTTIFYIFRDAERRKDEKDKEGKEKKEEKKDEKKEDLAKDKNEKK